MPEVGEGGERGVTGRDLEGAVPEAGRVLAELSLRERSERVAGGVKAAAGGVCTRAEASLVLRAVTTGKSMSVLATSLM